MRIFNHRFINTPIIKNNEGVVLVQVAILLPVFILLFFGIYQFGLYYVKDEFVNRAVDTAIVALQTDLTVATQNTNASPVNIEAMAATPGTLVDLTQAPNYICAQSYATEAAARSANPACSAGAWVTTSPGGVTPYWIAVSAYTLTNIPAPLFSPLKYIMNTQFVQVGTSASANGTELIVNGGFQHVQKLSGKGSWRVPADVTTVKATIIGAGGSGGGGQMGMVGDGKTGQITGGDGANGGGGGSGAVVVAYFTNLTAGQAMSYSVGAGGKGSKPGKYGDIYTGLHSAKSGNGLAGEASTLGGIKAGGGGGGYAGSAYCRPPDGSFLYQAHCTIYFGNGGVGGVAALGQSSNVGATVSYVVQPGFTADHTPVDGWPQFTLYDSSGGASSNIGNYYNASTDSGTPPQNNNNSGSWNNSGWPGCLGSSSTTDTNSLGASSSTGGSGGQSGQCGHNSGSLPRPGGNGGLGAGAGGGGGGGGGQGGASSGFADTTGSVGGLGGSGGNGADGIIILEY